MQIIRTAPLILAFLSLFVTQVPGQARREYTTRSRKAIQHYEAAVENHILGHNTTAFNELEKAKKRDSKFVEAYLLEAQIHETLRQYPQALRQCIEAIRIDSLFYPKVFLDAGRLAYYLQEYAMGVELIEGYLRNDDPTEARRAQAELIRASCLFAEKALESPLHISPQPLPNTVNTQFDEYFPSISADDKTLSITRLIPQTYGVMSGRLDNVQEDLFISRRADENAQWELAENIGEPVSTAKNEGAQSITADGQRMYFTRCQGPCNIYYSDRLANGLWSEPKALPSPVNLPGESDKQPSISPDGQTLYFASSRPGGYGSYDIWCATRNPTTGHWSSAVNLGPTINTRFDEQSPFIHFDNKTLYFSSNGHPGFGDLDLFTAQRINDTTWSVPRNLGFPINTAQTDMGLIVSPNAHTAYYASSRNPNTGLDIYTFTLPDTLRPTPVSYMRGTVTDATNGRPLPAQCQLVDLESGEVNMRPVANQLGQFLICLPVGRQYALFASHVDYFDHSLHFDFMGVHSSTAPYEQQIALMPMTKGQTLTLRNVFFATDSDALNEESYVELDRWAKLLQDRPSMRIRIVGHTDDQGEAVYNKDLSLRRARSVARYLAAQGVSLDRLECLGEGEEKPIESNSTPEGRARNRRTECLILSL